MAITLVTVTGPIVLATGIVPSFGRVEFALPTWDKQGSEVINQTVADFTLNSVGNFSGQLWATTTGAKGLSYLVTAYWWSATEGRELSDFIGYAAVSPGGPFTLASLITAIPPAVVAPNLLAQITAAQAAAAASASAALADRLLAEAAKNAVDLGALGTAVTASGASATAAAGSASTASAASTTATAEANRASRQNMMDPAGVPPRARDVIGVAQRNGGTAFSFVDRTAWSGAASAALAMSRPEVLGAFARASGSHVYGADRRLQTLANNVLPYGHNPANGQLLGYLPTRAETRILSPDLTTWTATGLGSVVAGIGAGGPGTGYLLTSDASTGGHNIQSSAVTVVGETYYLNVVARAGTIGNLRLQHSGTPNALVDFDLNSGLAVEVGAAAVALPTILLPDGRMILRMSFVSTSASGVVRISLILDGNISYTGVVTHTVSLSNPVLSEDYEKLPIPGATGVADVLSVDLTTVPWSNTSGSITIRADAAPADLGGVHGLLELRNTGSGAFLRVRASATNIVLLDGTTIITAPLENLGAVVVCLRWNEAGIEFYVNGTPYGRMANVLGTIAPNQIMIGNSAGGSCWDAPVQSCYFGPAFLAPADLHDVVEMRLNGAIGVVGAAPNRQVAIFANGGFFPLSHGDGDCYDPVFAPADREIRWTCNYKGAIVTRSFPLDMQSSLTRTNRDLRLLLGKGQSRRVGINSSPALTTTDVDAARAVMFQTGARLLAGAYPDLINTVVPPALLTRLVPLKAQTQGKSGEASEVRLALDWIGFGATNENILAINSAIGSSTIEEHSVGEEPWVNESAALARAAWLQWRVGGRLKRLTAFWDQGDGNAGDQVADHRDKLFALYDSLNARWQQFRDWQTVQGFADPGPCRLILTQFCVSTAVNRVPEAQAEAVLTPGGRLIHFSTPSYIFPNNGIDNHYINHAMARRGAYEARMLSSLEANAASDSLRMLSAARSGATITVSLSVAAPNLTMPVVIDTTTVSNNSDTRYGIRVDGITNGATITSVTVNGSNQIVIALSAVPTGTLSVTAGLNPESTGNQGPLVQSNRTNFRDSGAGNDLINAINYPRRNWLACGRVAVV